LSIYEKALGEQHPHVASVAQNLGRLYHNMGENDRAEALFLHALTLRSQIRGLEHPVVAQSLTALGDFLIDQGRDEQGEALLQRALAVYLQAYSSNHPEVVRVQETIVALQRKEEEHG
jgi:tetratricopeptide (TPR) repeat protein